MAYGKGSAGFGPNVKILSFRLKTKNLPAPQFEVSVKEGDKYVNLEPATRVSGDLIGIKHKSYQYEGKDIESVTATLRDGNEVYYVSIPYSYLGRNILNSLAGLKSFGGVEISVYKGKQKDPTKPAFDSSAVKQSGELVYGKYPYAQLPVIPKIKVGKDVHADPSEINGFFRKEVEELDKVIRTNSPVLANESHAPAADTSAPDDGADVPF